MSDQRKKVECRECDGFGYLEYESQIIDYHNGHDIWTDRVGCSTCCGQGWLYEDEVDWEEEE